MTERTEIDWKRVGLAAVAVAGLAAALVASGVREIRREEAERNAPPRWTDKNRWE